MHIKWITKKHSTIKLRPARLDELPTLLEFEQDLITYERPYAPILTQDIFNCYDLEAYIKSLEVVVVVAKAEKVVVGSG